MKTKTFRNPKVTCKTYIKSVGHGWECGFVYGGKAVFVGNFVHHTEAKQWFSQMNREISRFASRYRVGSSFPKEWFGHFMKNHLYSCYYSFLDRVFERHTRSFHRAVSRDVKHYHKISKGWTGRSRTPFLKAA
jgi:hypothetical protein